MADRTVTLGGAPLPLSGTELKPGDNAPDFRLHQKTDSGLEDVTLASFEGKTLIISVVPSLDTPVCELQTKRFNDEISKLPESVKVLTVSMDLPFAQARFCGTNDVVNVQTASDHRDASFGQAYGTLIEPLRLEARSIFVVSPDKKIKYVEYVPEVTDHPDYDKALAAAKE